MAQTHGLKESVAQEWQVRHALISKPKWPHPHADYRPHRDNVSTGLLIPLLSGLGDRVKVSVSRATPPPAPVRHGESFVKRTCAKHRSPRLAFPLWLALSSRRSGLVTEDWPFQKRAAWWRTARRRAAGQNPDD